MNTLIFALFFSLPAPADELVLPREVLQARGYRPAATAPAPMTAPELPRSLPWPVAFASERQTVAQNYVNFQDYGDGAYFHGGCDLRTAAGADVVAAVSGVLEGGYYGYDVREDGRLEKHWRPWKGRAERDPYFELAIVTPGGYRFEYHHVDAETLPRATVEALNRGNVRIEAGTVIGRVNGWAFPGYHHIHYNILRPDGRPVNPEFHSAPLGDRTPPVIHGVYGIDLQGKTVAIAANSTVGVPLREIVVATTESHDDDAYVQTPPFASLRLASGETLAWDFRQALEATPGRAPDIRDVFLPSLRLPNGRALSTWGRYGRGLSLIRFRLPAGAGGPFTLAVGDTEGNRTSFAASF